jgi:protein phosphatase
MTASPHAVTAEFPRVDDLLNRHFGPSPPRVQVQFGALTHPGLVRTNNEDHYVVLERRRSRSVLLTNLPEGLLSATDDTAYILGVADGMGGAAFGELASMTALRSGWDQAASAIKWTWIINDREIEDLKERVDIVFRRMHQDLLERARANPACAGMGTTLTAAYTVGPEAFICHVGDSRAYLYHEGSLARLTTDHTLAQQCLILGLPVLRRSWFHKLTNVLGGRDQEIHVEFHHVRLADGDRLLLCTDGLSDMMRDEEITDLLGRHAHLQEAAQALVDLALQRGGKDNVTVVLAQYALLEQVNEDSSSPSNNG